MDEIWVPISGYEWGYEISNTGKVRSINRTIFCSKNKTIRNLPQKELKQNDNGNGYNVVHLLSEFGERKSKYIHRLVAEAFVAKPLGKNVVNHKDYNRQNNVYSNLEWVTQKENVIYSAHRMKRPKCTPTKSKTGHKYIYERNGKYRVCFPGSKETVCISLDDAIKRLEVIKNGG